MNDLLRKPDLGAGRRAAPGRLHQQRVHAPVVAELGMEGRGEPVALAHQHRLAVDAHQHLDAGPGVD